MTDAAQGRDRGRHRFEKKTARMGEPPAGCVRLEDVRDGDVEQKRQMSAPAGEVEGMMARRHANSWGKQTPATAQADRLRSALAVYPLRQ
jgi:hypothetical protein